MMSQVISEIVAQHAEEAAFLWLLRRDAVHQPHYSLADLARLDDRIEAHLDGLRVAGAAGWEMARGALDTSGPGEIFTAAVLAFGGGEEGPMQSVLEVAVVESECQSALISALGWLPFEQAAARMTQLMVGTSPIWRLLGLAAAAIHRADPGTAIEQGILDEDPALRARALRAVGELGRLGLLPLAERHLKADDPEVRFSAAWSAALLSTKPEPLGALAAIAQSESRHRERALQTAMRRAELAASKRWQRRLKQEPGMLRLAVQGAGAIGDPEEMPWLIEQMRTPEQARIAGESFTMITGVDIAYQDLGGEPPEGFESGPTEDPADENVEMDPEENLPWPDPELIQNWWQSNRQAFQTGSRYLVGKPITTEWLGQVLRIGRQRQRAAAALELAMRQHGKPLFEIRAPGPRQKRMLGL